jgi:hypothetical protein
MRPTALIAVSTLGANPALASVTLVRSHGGEGTTPKAVRYYMIQVINGTTTFSCRHCNHSVTTRDFSSLNGNLRTQAARSMNEHAAAEHSRLKPMCPNDGQVWHAH